jgi:hypothetical protein
MVLASRYTGRSTEPEEEQGDAFDERETHHAALRALAATCLIVPRLQASASAAPATVAPSGTTLVVTAGDLDDRITAVGNSDTVTISDNQGLTPGAGCTAITETSLRCTGTIDAISVSAGSAAADPRATRSTRTWRSSSARRSETPSTAAPTGTP